MCVKVFCPYQNLQVETTHMKNCSLICAQLVLTVLITLTKGERNEKIICKGPSSRCDAHHTCPREKGPGSYWLPGKALCSTLLSAVYYVVIVMVSQVTFL
jgi:hypothetical protein